MNIDKIMKELAQYTRMQEETAAIIEGLKDTIKNYMVENNLEVLTSDEHTAKYKNVRTERIDTKQLKKDVPNIAAQYTIETDVKRFIFK